jgi:hypothetical protein|tara:strand:- start:423 stop:1109 length:687 start_codon:yes stop_codon:yes gene_type:complete
MAESKAVSLVSANVPAHVKESAGLGNENVSTQHLQTPRVKLLQQMNSEVDESHDAYVEGAKPGDLLNTVTNEIYGTEIYVINVHFTEDFVVWRKREKGGGLVASCASRADADEMIGNQDGSPNDYEIIQTQSHLLIRKDATTGEMESTPFLMDFASSKLRVSREWNTQIAQLGGDRFSTLWKVSSVKTQNRAGQPFQNLSVMKEGWVTDDDYEIAKKVYKGVSGNTGA